MADRRDFVLGGVYTVPIKDMTEVGTFFPEKFTFTEFQGKAADCRQEKNSCSLLRWDLTSLETIVMTSRKAKTELSRSPAKIELPWSPAETEFMRRWKVSGAPEMPKGIFLKQKWPDGVEKAVTSLDSLSSGTCQYPEISRVVKTLFCGPADFRISCKTGSGLRSCFQTLLSVDSQLLGGSYRLSFERGTWGNSAGY